MKFTAENKLIKNGLVIAGLDEAGRGPWAGPIVAGCLLINKQIANKGMFKLVNDSKKLNQKARKQVYDWLIVNFTWSVGVVSAKQIDKIGIVQANKLAFKKAIEKLSIKPDLLLVDYFSDIGVNIKTQGIVKGDQKRFCIAGASIIAKVYRDELMIKLAKKYSKWGFVKHKGYGTRLHSELLKKYGLSAIHRQSFAPIKDLLIS